MTSVAISALYTVLGAIGIALFQLTIKGIARLKNLQHGGGFKSLFKEDDFSFWHEWILAALVAMTIKVVGDSGEGQATAQTIIITFLLQIVFGLIGVPVVVAFILSDGHGVLKFPRGTVVADLMGLTFLIVSVAVGVQIYG